jgi:hypothetical protein
MKRLVPIRGSVVCKKLCGGTRTENRNGVKIKVSEVDEYEIISLPEIKDGYDGFFQVGDRVISNSTGDEMEVSPGESVFLFKLENLMCKVDEQQEKV